MTAVPRSVWIAAAALAAVAGIGVALEAGRPRDGILPQPRPYSTGPALAPGEVRPKVVYQNGCGLLLAPDGSLWAWGGGAEGWGFRPKIPSWPTAVPQRFVPGSRWRDVAVGGHHAVGVGADGSLWVWGSGAATLAASPATGAPVGSYPTPVRVGLETNWVGVAAGAAHAVGLRGDGSVWAWGQDAHGAVGDATSGGVRGTPVRSVVEGCTRVYAGAFATFAARADGSVWAWGSSGVGSTNLVPGRIEGEGRWRDFGAGDFHFAGIREDGSLWVGGGNSHLISGGAPMASLRQASRLGADQDWVGLVTGGDHLLARKSDGSWWAFGAGGSGQLGVGPGSAPGSVPSAPTRVLLDGPVLSGDASLDATGVLAPDGVLWGWGVRPGQRRFRAFWGSFGDPVRRFGDRLGLPEWAKPGEMPTEVWPEPRPLWDWALASRRDR